MTKKIVLPLLLFAVTSLFILPGCRKFIDYVEHHPGKDPRNVKIKKIIYPPILEGSTTPDTLTIMYNAQGNPVTALRPFTTDGAYDWYFTYDRFGRIISAFGAFEATVNSDGTLSGRGDWYHRYVYDKWNRIVVDTAYVGPVLDHGVLTVFHGASQFSNLEYDAQNRVIKEHVIELGHGGPGADFGITYYNYNADGNRIRNVLNPPVYDNKVNPNTTNPFWAFFNRDYSVNNPFPAAAYNSYGLPTKGTPIFPFLTDNGTVEFIYDKN